MQIYSSHMENTFGDRVRVGVADAILLEDFHNEEAFIDNLKKRYALNEIYTYIGQVLVSINPYCDLLIHSEETLEKYRNINFYEVPPHVYAIAENAYRSLITEGSDQCVLISGESGSGKTEASKHVLRCVAAASLHRRAVDKVRDRLLQSNPVLEAFGNAKTNRNDNSSRFGKYMDVEYNFKGDPVGGHIINYLLEKSRVIHQESGERNFHIFYQLIAGASDQLLADLHLERDAQKYHYLSQGKSSHVVSMNDEVDFNQISFALNTIDFTAEEQHELWKILAAILHLGNISYMSNDKFQLEFANVSAVRHTAELLQCNYDLLAESLTHRTIEASADVIKSALNIEQAAYARDALSKAIYERLFNWLVSRLNLSLQGPEIGKKTVMGILDIYGFEIFNKNGFEQFCINYCNEKLQQIFIELTLKSEQEEYEREGIQWETIHYFDNKIICDLVEERHKGIISLLDEECLRPGDSTDMTFLSKMDSKLGKHKHYFSYETIGNNNKVKKTLKKDEFRLRHYAGDVAYVVKGFIDKNNDLLYRDLKSAMAKSRSDIMATIFPKTELVSQKRPNTASTQFKTSLSQLMVILMSKKPSYIRCIKPNEFKKHSSFDQQLVSHQVKYLGLMENLRVRRAGFAHRRSYVRFLQRYKSLSPDTWPNFRGDPKDGVQLIVDHLEYTPEEYRMGVTKIFIKLPKTLFQTEDAFQLRKHGLATVIQAHYKGLLQRRRFVKMVEAVTVISKNYKRICAQKQLTQRRKAVATIRSFIRGFITRNGPSNEDNLNFQILVKCHWLNKLSRYLPRLVTDVIWPSCPASCEEASSLLKDMHKLYLTRKYVRNMDTSKKILFEEKILAEQLFKGKKANYEASFLEWFKSSRLASDNETLMKSSFEQDIKMSGEKTKYSTACIKYDRHGYKPRDRILVVTSCAIYLLERREKTLRKKHRFPLKEVEGLFVSRNADGLLILKTPMDKSNEDKGDLILNVPHVIEAITKIIGITDHQEVLTILDDESMNHTMKNGKQGTIILHQGPVSSFNKSKDGKLIVVG